MTDSEKMDLILEKLGHMESDIKEVKQDLTEVRQDVAETKQELTEVKEDVSEVKRRVTGIELHLENVTDKNIQIIAEGHLNLNRRLDEALKAGHEEELLIIRVRMLEDEVRKLKEKIA